MEKIDIKKLTMRSVPLMLQDMLDVLNNIVDKVNELEEEINSGKQAVVQSKTRSRKSTKPEDKPDV